MSLKLKNKLGPNVKQSETIKRNYRPLKCKVSVRRNMESPGERTITIESEDLSMTKTSTKKYNYCQLSDNELLVRVNTIRIFFMWTFFPPCCLRRLILKACPVFFCRQVRVCSKNTKRPKFLFWSKIRQIIIFGRDVFPNV